MSHHGFLYPPTNVCLMEGCQGKGTRLSAHHQPVQVQLYGLEVYHNDVVFFLVELLDAGFMGYVFMHRGPR